MVELEGEGVVRTRSGERHARLAHNKPSDPTTRAPQSFKPPPLPPAHTYWAQILDMMDDDQWRRSRRTILASMHPDPSESSGNEEKFKKVSELLELIEKLRKKTKNGA